MTLSAQPRLTFDYPAMARRIVRQLALQPGERVLSIAHPGTFAELLPHIRYEVMRAGGIDLGVVDVLQEPVPGVVRAGRAAEGRERRARRLQGDVPRRRRRHHDARRQHVASRVSRDAGLAEGRPGRTARPADDSFSLGGGRQRVSDCRTAAAAAVCIDAMYQRALLETDYAALAAAQRKFAAALQERRGARHLAGRHRPAVPRRRPAGEPSGRRRVARRARRPAWC